MSHASPFFRDLENIRGSLSTMGELAGVLLGDSVASFVARDRLLAEEVIRRDDDLDAAEQYHEERTIQIIGLNSPVARDLRLLVAFLRINTTIERAGDLTVNIADTTLRMIDRPPLRPYVDIPSSYNHVRMMWDDAIAAFCEMDSALAAHVVARDEEADLQNQETIRQLLEIGNKHPDLVFDITNLIGLSKILERIGDLAADIANEVIYVEEGILRHTRNARNTA